MNLAQLGMVGGGFLVCGLILYLNLWRAVLFVKPSSILIEPDAPPDQMGLPKELTKFEAFLTQQGFVALGSHYEKPRFGKDSVSYDYALEGKGVFATLYVGRDGGTRLYFLSPVEGGGFVVTANYRRPARELKGHYYSGGLEEYEPERVFKAHLRRIDNEGLKPRGPFTLEDRLKAGRDWFQGYGESEIRAQNLHGLLWTVATVVTIILACIRIAQ